MGLPRIVAALEDFDFAQFPHGKAQAVRDGLGQCLRRMVEWKFEFG